MALLGSVQDVGLLAEEGMSLIVNILDNFGPGSPIFDSQRVMNARVTVGVGAVDALTPLVLMVELSDAILEFVCAMRWML